MWESVKNCSKLCKETGICGWISRVARDCKLPEWCTHAKHAKGWSVAPAVALQDKSPRLARPFARSLNSRLNPVVRSSHWNTLFKKNWLFTFLLTPLYIYPYTYNLESVSRENFERETLEKNKIDSSPIFIKRLQIPLLSSSPLLNPWEAYYQNLFSLYPFLWEGCLVLWEAIRNEPISHWLMLWSSSGIQEARKEIGSAQPRWGKKLRGLR